MVSGKFKKRICLLRKILNRSTHLLITIVRAINEFVSKTIQIKKDSEGIDNNVVHDIISGLQVLLNKIKSLLDRLKLNVYVDKTVSMILNRKKKLSDDN